MQVRRPRVLTDHRIRGHPFGVRRGTARPRADPFRATTSRSSLMGHSTAAWLRPLWAHPPPGRYRSDPELGVAGDAVDGVRRGAMAPVTGVSRHAAPCGRSPRKCGPLRALRRGACLLGPRLRGARLSDPSGRRGGPSLTSGNAPSPTRCPPRGWCRSRRGTRRSRRRTWNARSCRWCPCLIISRGVVRARLRYRAGSGRSRSGASARPTW